MTRPLSILATCPASVARTSRERDVLDHLAPGATDKEIAIQLSISVHTVKSHVRSILNKLHAVNRRQAARLAAQLGLLNNQGR